MAVLMQAFATFNQSGAVTMHFLLVLLWLLALLFWFDTSPVSGAHMSPAITSAFWLLTKMNMVQVMQYFAAQFLGASLVWDTFEMDGIKSPPFLLGSNSSINMLLVDQPF